MKPSLRLSAAFSLLLCASQALVGTTQTTTSGAGYMSSTEFLTGVRPDHTEPTPNTVSTAQQMFALLTLLTAANAGDSAHQLNANSPEIMLDNPRQASLVAGLPRRESATKHTPAQNRHVPRLTRQRKCSRR